MDPDVQAKFDSYPPAIRKKMLRLRKLVLDTAKREGLLEGLQESLKWGEPSYSVKGGSTVRMDWKERDPQHYALYFSCQSSLVSTFREIHGEHLTFEGNRAIVIERKAALPAKALGHCISLALRYHKLKHLPLLGA